MATLTLTYSAAHGQRIADAFTTRFGYQDVLPDGQPNPQTKVEFVKGVVADWIRGQVRDHEGQTAAAAAAAAVTSVTIT